MVDLKEWVQELIVQVNDLTRENQQKDFILGLIFSKHPEINIEVDPEGISAAKVAIENEPDGSVTLRAIS